MERRALIANLRSLVLSGLRRAGADLAPQVGSTGGIDGIALRWKDEEPWRLPGVIVDSQVYEKPIRFFVSRPRDHIQAFHAAGRFYEEEELAIISSHYSGGTFVDVGANVGNHSLFMLTMVGAGQAILFEPNPQALKLLRINLALNNLASRVTVHEVGLSDHSGEVAIEVPERNLGAGRLVAGGSGAKLRILRGDELLADADVGFIKMDVEGLELSALAGMSDTIRRCRPVLFVEVEDVNRTGFESFLAQHGYVVSETYRRYPLLANYLAVPG